MGTNGLHPKTKFIPFDCANHRWVLRELKHKTAATSWTFYYRTCAVCNVSEYCSNTLLTTPDQDACNHNWVVMQNAHDFRYRECVKCSLLALSPNHWNKDPNVIKGQPGQPFDFSNATVTAAGKVYKMDSCTITMDAGASNYASAKLDSLAGGLKAVACDHKWLLGKKPRALYQQQDTFFKTCQMCGLKEPITAEVYAMYMAGIDPVVPVIDREARAFVRNAQPTTPPPPPAEPKPWREIELD